MFKQKMEFIFIGIIIFFLSYLTWSFYESYTFKTQKIPQNIQTKIDKKEQELLSLMQTRMNITPQFPLI
jgi:predicted negative regulator of RcsB-dependent stress response